MKFSQQWMLWPQEKTGKTPIKLKIDTGASGNTLTLQTFRNLYGKRDLSKVITPVRNTKLTAYNGQKIPCYGSLDLELSHKGKLTKAKFYVVDVEGACIIGLPTCEKLKLVTINCNEINTTDVSSVESLKQAYPGQFDTLGDFQGPAQLHTKLGAEPSIDPPRKCSVHLEEQLKAELEKMVKQGVIRKVKEHTDWCSSLAYSVKKDGSLRICIDPQKLNAALKRCPHKIPTLEEINPKFTGSSVFSKMDAKAGYWSVHLDEPSQLLTTFRTPFGRYCWKRLPFGLRVSQDIFQARMDEILEDLPGVAGITDDVCVHGKDVQEHDDNLRRLMERAKQCGLVFNSEKCDIRKNEISFFGNIYSKDGIRPDPAKVQGIQSMPVPENKEDLQRFLGMMTYLSMFIPNFSKESQPLRELLKTDVPFVMSEDLIHCFNNLKKLVSSTIYLKFFDPKKPTVLEVDSSMKGLGAAIIQDGYPVAFASKSLDSTQSNYPNIDREMLAVVFGITRFHTYLYGRPFKVITDQKPLEMIVQKPLLKAPPRLQRMLQKIQGYDYVVEYRSGKSMTLADTLSRLPSQADKTSLDLDLRVDGLDLSKDEIGFCQYDFISFTPKKQYQLREATKTDPVLNSLMETIVHGWPDNIKALPVDVRPYWSFRDELAIEDGIIFKGQEVVVPEALRQDVLRQLHQSHQGLKKTRLLAKECAYWPNIFRDIEQAVRSCATCQEFASANSHEPLLPHDIPNSPWRKLGTDLFEIEGRNFLLIADYFSKYPIVTQMRTTTSQAIAEEMEKVIAMFGRPDQIISDNGPQYQGQPFKVLMDKYGIEHITSSPRYPQSNGFIERQVQTVKKTIKKCDREGKDFQLAMLNLRATPVDSKLPSPAEMLFGHPIATLLPSRVAPRAEYQQYKVQLDERRQTMKTSYDKSTSSDLPPLYSGQDIRILNKETKRWEPGQVVNKASTPRSYNVRTYTGNTLRRNRIDLRERVQGEETSTCKARDAPTQQQPCGPKEIPAPDRSTSANIQSSSVPQAPLDNQMHVAESPPSYSTTRSGREVRMPLRYREE